MADISKLKIPDGTTYNLKDETARAGLAGKAAASHTHTKSQITDFPTSLPANGGNADTVDGYHVDNLIHSGVESVPPVYFTDIARINHDKKTIERWDTGNLGVAFANSATNADTVDGKHASDFAEASHTHNYAGETSGGFMSADDKIKLDGLSKITVEHFDATTDEWSHVSLFATGGKIPIAAVFSYNTVMYSIFVYNGYYYISAYDTSMNAIPNTAVSFDLICKEG